MIDFDSGFAERQKYETREAAAGWQVRVRPVGIGPTAAARVALERTVDYFALC
jgi:hypothetical protein